LAWPNDMRAGNTVSPATPRIPTTHRTPCLIDGWADLELTCLLLPSRIPPLLVTGPGAPGGANAALDSCS
jgi:hypothetical protein